MKHLQILTNLRNALSRFLRKHIVSTSSAPIIIWRYHYLQACKEVTVNDKIDLTPDEVGRWQIRGFLRVKTKAMPEYKWAGKSVLVPFAWINQKGCTGASVPSTVDKFCCHFPYIYDANLGYGSCNIFGNTPNEVMAKVQKEFEKTHRCFLNWC
jgi:hypothetical protein